MDLRLVIRKKVFLKFSYQNLFTLQRIFHYYRFSRFPDEAREVLIEYILALYKDRKSDRKGKIIIAMLAERLSGRTPTNKREWIRFYKLNLKLTEALAPRIENSILRKALEDRNKDTESLLKKLESGQGTQKDIAEYNARTVRKLKQALEEYGKGGRQIDTEEE